METATEVREIEEDYYDPETDSIVKVEKDFHFAVTVRGKDLDAALAAVAGGQHEEVKWLD
jgi:hypothetical protein